MIVQLLSSETAIQNWEGLLLESSDSETGPWTELDVIELQPGVTVYHYSDPDGTLNTWYRTAYTLLDRTKKSSYSDPFKAGDETVKVGYTFENYSPSPGTWGKVYTADDMRYTWMFGIDSVGSDIAATEFSDRQLESIVEEALGEFEGLLGMDIRRKKYVTYPDDSLVQARKWAPGVDYTNEDAPYDFDPQLWNNYGFIQLRHWPLIKVTRAIWYSPVKGEVMNMLDNNWLRLHKDFGQVRMFPTGGFSYGPYSVYGPLWTGNYARQYPGGFEFDYETGYKNSDLVPEGLRTTIGKYAAIKTLAVVGDGLLAGFSSQSVSLDGLSESFSSTQSATSAYFGARIKQYSDEIQQWLERNRYKYSPVPISFVSP